MRHLIIFIRKPVLGIGKTRIAATTGAEKALDIYKQLLTHTRLVAEKVDAIRHLWYAGEIDAEDGWSSEKFTKQLQPQGDLGEKMRFAFEAIPTNEPKIIVGSDCIDLRPSIIEAAFEALKSNDAVIGPATDGGYYLLGLRQIPISIFEEMEWSTSEVGAITKQRIATLGWTLAEVDTLSDIDTEVDWEAAKDRIWRE